MAVSDAAPPRSPGHKFLITVLLGLLLSIPIFAIYLLVVLGFLKGSDGANQYGPDPLGGVAATA